MAEVNTTTETSPAPAAAEPATPGVHLTEVAAEKVREIRNEEDIEESMGLRLRVVGGGCSGFSYDLYFDEQTPMDVSFTQNGVQMYVDQMSLMYLDGTTIDYVEGLMGAGFKFNNPNVTSTCGCGSSFAV